MMARGAAAAALALLLAGCQGGNPLDTSSGPGKAAVLRAECQDALDELYAQAPRVGADRPLPPASKPDHQPKGLAE